MLYVCFLFNLYQNYNSLDRSSSSSMPSPSSSSSPSGIPSLSSSSSSSFSTPSPSSSSIESARPSPSESTSCLPLGGMSLTPSQKPTVKGVMESRPRKRRTTLTARILEECQPLTPQETQGKKGRRKTMTRAVCPLPPPLSTV